jgi:hypothetical protein
LDLSICNFHIEIAFIVIIHGRGGNLITFMECVFQWFHIHQEVARSQLRRVCLPVILHSQGGGKVTIRRVCLPVISHSPGGGQVTITESSSSSDFTFTRRWPSHNYGEFVFQWFHIHQEVARSHLRRICLFMIIPWKNI